MVMKRILRIKDVSNYTGLSRTTIWRREKNNEFPKRVSLGVGAVGWYEHEVEEWLNSRDRKH